MIIGARADMDTYQFLSGIDPFRKLPPEKRLMVSRQFREKVYPEGSILIAQGKTIQEVGVVRDGSAKITIVDHTNEELICGSLEPGDLVFDRALLSGTLATTKVITLEPTVCLILTRKVFFELIDSNPLLKQFFYQNIALGVKWGHLLIAGRYTSAKLDESQPQFIRRALAYIERNFDKPITLEHLSNITAMSKYHFSRQFKQQMGISFKRYLNLKRVEAAKALISGGEHNVTEACYAVGFNDASYFTRVFREMDGSSPKNYIAHGCKELEAGVEVG